MKVVFIYLDFGLGAGGKYYSGIGYLVSYLKQHGHSASLIHIIAKSELPSVIKKLENEAPDLVAFSCTTNMFSHVKRIISDIKRQFDVPIICGGPHVTLNPEQVLMESGTDFVCINEGEQPLLELCDALVANKPSDNIRNIWSKQNGRIHKTEVRPLIDDLDALPFPDRHVFDYSKLGDAKMNRHTFLASRGCPFDCTYCCNSILKQKSDGTVNYTRWRSAENVIQEIKETLLAYPANLIHFHDDLFTLKLKWLQNFCDHYKKEIDLPFICNSRVGILNEDRVKCLKMAGCQEIMIGIESGAPHIRSDVLNRKMTNSDILETFSLCYKYGIAAHSFNMVGIPFETPKDILETIKINAMAKVSNIQVSIFYPYPGTKLHSICKEKGWIIDKTTDSYFEDVMLNQPSVSRKQVLHAYKYFRYYVYLYRFANRLPNPINRFIEKGLDNLFFVAGG